MNTDATKKQQEVSKGNQTISGSVQKAKRKKVGDADTRIVHESDTGTVFEVSKHTEQEADALKNK